MSSDVIQRFFADLVLYEWIVNDLASGDQRIGDRLVRMLGLETQNWLDTFRLRGDKDEEGAS